MFADNIEGLNIIQLPVLRTKFFELNLKVFIHLILFYHRKTHALCSITFKIRQERLYFEFYLYKKVLRLGIFKSIFIRYSCMACTTITSSSYNLLINIIILPITHFLQRCNNKKEK